MTDNRSIADVELLKREKHLAAVPVTEKILSLQLFDMDGRSLYEIAHQFPLEPYLPKWASRVFTDDASIHIDAMGLNVTEFPFHEIIYCRGPCHPGEQPLPSLYKGRGRRMGRTLARATGTVPAFHPD